MSETEFSRDFGRAAAGLDDGFHVHNAEGRTFLRLTSIDIVGGSYTCGDDFPDYVGMNQAKEIGSRIKALRKQRGEVQAVVAEAIGIERASLSMIETGGDMPGRATLLSLAAYFGVSVDALIGDGPMPAPLDREVIQDPNEIALVRLWRGLLPVQRSLVTRLLQPPASKVDDVA